MRAAAEGGGELADLFDQPNEGAFDAAGLVLFKIHFADQGLEIAERDVGRLVCGGCGCHEWRWGERVGLR
jgi:hypothetical protein